MTRWSVVVTERFDASHASAMEFITSEAKADRITAEGLKRIRTLDENPRRGRKIPEIMDDNYREFIIEDYRLMYRVTDESRLVEVLLLWPARKPFEPEQLLDGE